MMIVMNGVRVCVRAATPPLEVLATDEAAIGVDIRRRHRADFFEVKIENSTIDLEGMSAKPRLETKW